MVVCLQPVWLVQAQHADEWTKKDSLWLEDVKSGKVKLKLNDATLRAIQSGTLIAPEGISEDGYKHVPSKIPITKSFTHIHPLKSLSPNLSPGMRWLQYHKLAASDTLYIRPVDIKELPPNVFIHYEPEYPPELDLASFRLYNKNKEELNALTPAGIYTFSAEDFLRSIFWKSHRAKKRNAKKANAWKTYHSIP